MLVNAESGEVFLYGPIGPDFWEDGITDEMMVRALAEIGDNRATIHINSPGGVADHGVAIYNILRQHSAGVDTIVESLAASAASIIALAGENRYIAKGGRWMIHQALTIAVGNADEMVKQAEVLRKYDASMAEIYGDHMSESAEAIDAMMKAETWFNSQESIDAGLSTAMLERNAEKPYVANWFANAPENLFESPAATAKPKFPAKRQAARLRNILKQKS